MKTGGMRIGLLILALGTGIGGSSSASAAEIPKAGPVQGLTQRICRALRSEADLEEWLKSGAVPQTSDCSAAPDEPEAAASGCEVLADDECFLEVQKLVSSPKDPRLDRFCRMLLEGSRDPRSDLRMLDELELGLSQSGVPGCAAWIVEIQGQVYWEEGKFQEAQTAYGMAAENYYELGLDGFWAEARHNQLNVLRQMGEPEEAREGVQRVVQAFIDANLYSRAAVAVASVGEYSLRSGNLTGADAEYREALRLLCEGSTEEIAAYMATMLTNLAEVRWGRGHPGDAEKLHHAARTLHCDQEDYPGAVYDTIRLGRILHARGDEEAAVAGYERGLEVGGSEDRLVASDFLTQLYLELSRLDEAQEQAQRTLDLAKQHELEVSAPAVSARTSRAHALFRQGPAFFARASSLLERAREQAEENREVVNFLETKILWACERAMSADTEGLRAILADLDAVAEGQGKGPVYPQSLQARLAAGEIELAHGRRKRGKKRLRALQRDARKLGFEWMAQRAHNALKTYRQGPGDPNPGRFACVH